ncbi:hypothetical protein [Salegentibacter chungangensis]|uniref:Uncharacterized protein n=1 Tax=Salegentibacter chungangensis TaxID=1335724 RepID=A0ABW3NR37_9FLAO
MKKLNLLILVLALSIGSAISAFAQPDAVDNETSVKAELQKMLEEPNFEVEGVYLANVVFTLNKDNEMVVLTVDSDNETVKAFVKQRLNYKKLKSQLDQNIKEYKLPVRIQA